MPKYTVIENPMGTIIKRDNEDGTITYIPADPANSDYQAYLNPVEHLTENPTEDVE